MSLPVSVVEAALKLRRSTGVFNTDEEKSDQAFAAKSEGEEERFGKYPFKSPVEKLSFDGMFSLLLNPESGSGKCIVYYHGGGYVSQASTPHFKFTDRLALKTGVSVYVPDYPLAPRHTADEAYEKLLSMCREISGKYKEIIFMGDSAGGGLALGLAEKLRDMGERGPDKIVLISPWLDVTASSPEAEKYAEKDAMLSIYALLKCGKLWAGERDTRDPMISPAFGNLDDLGKISVFTGTHDILNLDAQLLRSRCEENNIKIEYVERPGNPHVYMLTPVAAASEDFTRVCEIVAT